MRTLSSLAFSAAVLGAACGDPPARPPILGEGTVQPGAGGGSGGSSSSTDGGARTDTGEGTDAGACTDLEDLGAFIEQTAVTGDPPIGTGGTIEDGSYTLVEARVFVGPSGIPGPTERSFKGAIRITGETFERVLARQSSGGATSETRATGTLSQSGSAGTNVLIRISCPAAAQEQVTYSVAGSTLVLSDLVTNESFTFTRN